MFLDSKVLVCGIVNGQAARLSEGEHIIVRHWFAKANVQFI